MTEMHTHGRLVLDELGVHTKQLRAAIPEVYQGYAQLNRAAMAEGELDRKTKELIALSIGVVKQCDGCIAAHALGAVRAGASRQEAAEAIGVTFLMNGGPATVYGARAYDAFCELAAAEEAKAAAAAGMPAGDAVQGGGSAPA